MASRRWYAGRSHWSREESFYPGTRGGVTFDPLVTVGPGLCVVCCGASFLRCRLAGSSGNVRCGRTSKWLLHAIGALRGRWNCLDGRLTLGTRSVLYCFAGRICKVDAGPV